MTSHAPEAGNAVATGRAGHQGGLFALCVSPAPGRRVRPAEAVGASPAGKELKLRFSGASP
ncbi:hypothetical protein DIZ27_34890 [Streptomyces sp. NWU339]|uniref:hypothetical protein n=1 Tax=Streptomyces sp. NWU339 TaxID=2185284 RepID=UPI000D6751F8|nr:hypothetical protein [Streptomyces sp. NWU339]PWI06215.1 hypothetical protein DIZ27_34890 [Streptomyces sp. NWU339]